jgi:hypothetical protein
VPSTRVGSAWTAVTRDVGEFAHALSNVASATKTQFPTLAALLNVTPNNDAGCNLPEFVARVDSSRPPLSKRARAASGENQGATERLERIFRRGGAEDWAFVYTP